MGQVTAKLVKDLRERTGAGMMDCKKALAEVDADLERAVDWLRQKGLSAAAKKAGRTAAEGLVGIATNDKVGAIVEVNSETDFVARNEHFQAYVKNTAQQALKATNLEELTVLPYPDSSRTVGEQLTENIATIGENMQLRRMARLEVSQGTVATYIHNALTPELGKIGVLVALESAADIAKLQQLGRSIAMHVAASSPLSMKVEDLDQAVIERERQVYQEQAKDSGKPDNVIEKMIEGRLKKFYQESVLLEQTYVIDGERPVKQVITDASKEFGCDVTLVDFVLFKLGEGLEKKSEDFAAEVAAQIK